MNPSDAIATRDKMRQMKVCTVMPTYNNGGTLRDVVERVLTYCTDVIVVNDGCTDDSAEILAALGDIMLNILASFLPVSSFVYYCFIYLSGTSSVSSHQGNGS